MDFTIALFLNRLGRGSIDGLTEIVCEVPLLLPVPLVAALFAVVMCLSRVHDGMHYPTDVLAGSALGMVYGALAIQAVGKARGEVARHRAARLGEPRATASGAP